MFNITKDKAITSDDSNNLTLERITGKENIYTYYREMFETYYVLDYLTGQAFLQLTPDEQAKVAVQVTYQNSTDYEVGGSKTTYSQISADDFRKMHLEDMDDLWDNRIALRAAGSVGDGGSYGGDNHYSIYWYQPHNNNGRPDSYSFKRLGFEMLGVGGYSDGYVTYRSGKSTSDLDALRKITKNDSITWKQYKLDRYEHVKENLSRIPYFDAKEVIAAYKQALEKDAIAGNRNNTNNLRRILYGIVKRTTKDFTTGTIYSLDEEIEITSEKQFIDVLNSSEWGNYKITRNLDFSNINTEGNSYISKTFVGRIDGDGHSITGLTKPLFSQVVYGEIQDLNINEPIYSENTDAILAITSKQLLLNNVVVNDSNINLPFVGTNQGAIQWLGTTAININEYEINSLEDLEKITSDNLSRKKRYKLNVDQEKNFIKSFLSRIPLLDNLNTHGNVVIKIYTIYTQMMIDLIILLSKLFKTSYIYIPYTVESYRNEKYLVLMNYNPNDKIITFLKSLDKYYINLGIQTSNIDFFINVRNNNYVGEEYEKYYNDALDKSKQWISEFIKKK